MATPSWRILVAPPWERSQSMMPTIWWGNKGKKCSCFHFTWKPHGGKEQPCVKEHCCPFRALWRWSRPMTVPWQLSHSTPPAQSWLVLRRRWGFDFLFHLPSLLLHISPSWPRFPPQGTVIRVFSIPEGQKLFEFRRGMKRLLLFFSRSLGIKYWPAVRIEKKKNHWTNMIHNVGKRFNKFLMTWRWAVQINLVIFTTYMFWWVRYFTALPLNSQWYMAVNVLSRFQCQWLTNSNVSGGVMETLHCKIAWRLSYTAFQHSHCCDRTVSKGLQSHFLSQTKILKGKVVHGL